MKKYKVTIEFKDADEVDFTIFETERKEISKFIKDNGSKINYSSIQRIW